MLAVLVDGDEELLEEELVEHAADVFGCLPVRVPRVLSDVEGDADERVCFGEVGAEVAETPVSGCELDVEALLFATEHVDGDGVVVMGFEELALATLDGLLYCLELFPLHVGVCAEELEAVAQQRLQVVAEVGGEADAVVEILDERFDVLDLRGAEGAVGAL